MKYETLTAAQEADQIRSRLNAAEVEHVQLTAAVESGLDGVDPARLERLEDGIKKLQALLADAEKRAKGEDQ